jgi:HSP20 family protein
MALEVAQDAAFGQMAKHMARMAEQMQRGYFEYSPAQCWTPNVNLYEKVSTYLVCVDLAGVDKDKIEVSVADGVLHFHGHRAAPLPSPEGCSRCRVHLMEIDHGAFSREIELPADADTAGVTARHDNGLLWIVVPKRTNEKPLRP